MDTVQIITMILAAMVIAAAIKNFVTSEKLEWGFYVFVALVMIPFGRVLELF